VDCAFAFEKSTRCIAVTTKPIATIALRMGSHRLRFILRVQIQNIGFERP
jgi:hypothetical protein